MCFAGLRGFISGSRGILKYYEAVMTIKSITLWIKMSGVVREGIKFVLAVYSKG